MTAAIFGLLGVVVGGLITAIAQWWRDGRERRRKTLRAARLVYEELAFADKDIRLAIEHNAFSIHPTSTAVWNEYAPDLAGALGPDEWGNLIICYRAVGLFEASWRAAGWRDDDDVAHLQTARDQVEAGLDALIPFAFGTTRQPKE